MESDMLNFFMNQGPWAVLFVSFYFYDQKRQDKREKRWEEREIKYQGIITQLTEKFNIVDVMQNDVKEIKEHIFKK